MPDLPYIIITKIISLTALSLLVVYGVSRHNVAQLDIPELHIYECDVSESTGTELFNIYLPTNWNIEKYAQNLCSNALHKSKYMKVRISWQPRETITTDHIVKQQFQLLWIRKNRLQGLFSGFEDLYTPLIAMPEYEIFWFSHLDNLEINQQLFDNHTLGLLEDQKSLSGYQAPLRDINQRQITLSGDNVIYYHNRQDMVQDFISGKLDIIPGIKEMQLFPGWRQVNSIPISKSTMGNLYIIKDTPLNLHCPLSLATAEIVPIFKNILQANSGICAR